MTDELTTAEVAALAGCSPSAVRRYRQAGALPARRLGTQWLYDAAAARAWAAVPRRRGPVPGSHHRPRYSPPDGHGWVGVTVSDRARAVHIADTRRLLDRVAMTVCGRTSEPERVIPLTSPSHAVLATGLPLCARCAARIEA